MCGAINEIFPNMWAGDEAGIIVNTGLARSLELTEVANITHIALNIPLSTKKIPYILLMEFLILIACSLII